MLTLDPSRLAKLTIPIGTGWLLGACMEARGKQDLWIGQKLAYRLLGSAAFRNMRTA
jgi:hypothetical protein